MPWAALRKDALAAAAADKLPLPPAAALRGFAMSPAETHVVTGAFGFSGKYIAQRLLDHGCRVKTLTNSPPRFHAGETPLGDALEVHPLDFQKPDQLTASLAGARVLYNTYWVRFSYKSFSTRTHAQAVENSRILFRSARDAGVERIVHLSITNPSLDSPLDYFRGKAQVEEALRNSGVSYCILRPAVLFGTEGILINNIAWLLRRLPVFGVFGKGDYRLQPIYVDDLAALAVEQGQRCENSVINAIGPETFAFRELVRLIARAIGKRRLIISVPPMWGYLVGWVLGKLLGDVILTWDELRGLTAEMLYVDAPPAGATRLTDWMTLAENAETLGTRYASELGRRIS